MQNENERDVNSLLIYILRRSSRGQSLGIFRKSSFGSWSDTFHHFLPVNNNLYSQLFFITHLVSTLDQQGNYRTKLHTRTPSEKCPALTLLLYIKPYEHHRAPPSSPTGLVIVEQIP